MAGPAMLNNAGWYSAINEALLAVGMSTKKGNIADYNPRRCIQKVGNIAAISTQMP
jgi:hypothetical protein